MLGSTSHLGPSAGGTSTNPRSPAYRKRTQRPLRTIARWSISSLTMKRDVGIWKRLRLSRTWTPSATSSRQKKRSRNAGRQIKLSPNPLSVEELPRGWSGRGSAALRARGVRTLGARVTRADRPTVFHHDHSLFRLLATRRLPYLARFRPWRNCHSVGAIRRGSPRKHERQAALA